MVVRREGVSIPLTERRRAFPEIDQDIKDRPSSDPDELGLCVLPDLVMQPSKNVLLGSAVVVLHKVEVHAELGVSGAVPRLHKEASVVTKQPRPKQPCSVNLSGDFFHARCNKGQQVDPARVAKLGGEFPSS